MNGNESYTVSQALMLQLDPRGFWLGTNSVSRAPQVVGDDALPVLAAFARPSTPGAALEALSAEWQVDPNEFETIVSRLVGLGFLSTGNGDGFQPAVGGFAQVLPHFFMLRDSVRVAAYRGAIERHCAGKSVLEIGCGTGILSIFAAQAAARSVIAIEESEIAQVARGMFTANGCEQTVDLRLGNSRDVEIDQPAEVIVHEILGTDPLAENLLVFLDDARRRLLAPGGRLIPYRLEIACVGVELEAPPAIDRDRAVAEMRQLAATYGVRFDPVIEELRQTPANRFPRSLSFPMGEPFAAPILTAETRLWDLDLRQPPAGDLGRQRKISLDVERRGRLGAVLMFFHAHLDEHAVLSTSPFAPPTHWGWDVRPLAREVDVTPGTTVELEVGTRVSRGIQRIAIDWA